MNYHVEVNTAGDREGVFTGNRVDHETIEIAEEAARDLFHRWTAVNHWRVVDDNGVVITQSNLS